MIKFVCENCKARKNLTRATIKIIEGKVRVKEAQCECGEWMREIEKKFEGFTTNIIRTDPTLIKK
tara:strand:+ start:2618 stop:2812 length:195 start_codon:yes stop_codon:yes gene_type:complete